VTAALDRCAAQGYLDDAATARSYVAERQQRMGLGRSRLAAELKRRGVAAPVVAAALAGIGEEDELARAREAAAKWQRKGGSSAAALARHLDRKGFSRRAILAALEGAEAADAIDLPDAEAEPAD
jgi:regulatory protein